MTRTDGSTTTPISTKWCRVEIWFGEGVSVTLEARGGWKWVHIALTGPVRPSALKALRLAIPKLKAYHAPVYCGVSMGRRSIEALVRWLGARRIGRFRDDGGQPMALYVWSSKDA